MSGATWGGASRGFALGIGTAVALTLGAYANHFRNAFHFDDAHVIEDNLAIRDLGNVPRFFTDAATFSTLTDHQTYRPLLSTSLAVDYAVAGGLDPVVFHATQFLLHLLVAAGVGLLAFRTFQRAGLDLDARWPALLAATIFSVHTANTETVNYLSARSDILSTLGILGSFVTYLYLPWSRHGWLYLIPMLAGALAKPPAVMFAPLFLLWIWLFEEKLSLADIARPERGDRIWRALLRAAPVFVAGTAAFVLVEAMNSAGQDYGGVDRIGYLRTQGWAWLHYARLFVAPVGLTADTDWTVVQAWTDTRVVVGWGAAALGVMGAIAGSRRAATRPIAFGLMWFFVGLLPSSSVFPLAEVVNEHRLYLPFVGLTLASVWAVVWGARRARAAPGAESSGRASSVSWRWTAAVATLLAAHAIGTSVRNRDWRTEETLWADVVEKSPGNGRAWMNYGLARMAEGEYPEAARLFGESVARSPNYPPVHVNLGIVTNRLGDPVAAEAHFLRALALDARYVPGYHFYARFLVRSGRGPEAIDHLRTAVGLAPTYADPGHLLLQLYYLLGATDEVRRLAEGILDHDADDPVANELLSDSPGGVPPADGYERGLALTNEGSHLDAGLAYRAYLAAVPGDLDALLNLGWSQAQVGFNALAAVTFQQVLAVRPDDALARNNLAWVQERLAARGELPPTVPGGPPYNYRGPAPVGWGAASHIVSITIRPPRRRSPGP